MPNGKPGDHPFTDIVVHGEDVYSPDIANLVREISKLASEKECRELADLLLSDFNDLLNPDIERLQQYLTTMRDRLRQEAKARGWEI